MGDASWAERAIRAISVDSVDDPEELCPEYEVPEKRCSNVQTRGYRGEYHVGILSRGEILPSIPLHRFEGVRFAKPHVRRDDILR